jgi:hypothetical protein
MVRWISGDGNTAEARIGALVRLYVGIRVGKGVYWTAEVQNGAGFPIWKDPTEHPSIYSAQHAALVQALHYLRDGVATVEATIAAVESVGR